MKVIQLSLIFLTVVLFFSCSSSDKTIKTKTETEELKDIFTQEVKANFIELNVWVNLMPNAENRFHISGIVEVFENFKYDINFINLKDIEVKQDQNIIYILTPIIQLDPDLSTDTKKTFRFSTTKGLLLTPEVNIDNPCNLEFNFDDGNELYTYLIDNVKIEKTY